MLQRIADPRARQFWDPEHRIALRMAKDARPPQPEPECCTQKGVLWDLVAVYRPGQRWEEAMPAAVLFGGTVVDNEGEIEAEVR